MAEAEQVPAPAASEEAQLKANRSLGLTVAVSVLLLDQLIKWAVTSLLHLADRGEIVLLPIFKLTWTQNIGVSMGFLNADNNMKRWLLIALTAAIAGFVVAWLWREKRRDDAMALGLVLGGALGNILDRVRLGYVIDYANLHFGDISPFLVFNVGDLAITIGVLLLLVRALLTRERKTPREKV
jgi:signal peptidase II